MDDVIDLIDNVIDLIDNVIGLIDDVRLTIDDVNDQVDNVRHQLDTVYHNTIYHAVSFPNVEAIHAKLNNRTAFVNKIQTTQKKAM